jgi:hypothetical protein
MSGNQEKKSLSGTSRMYSPLIFRPDLRECVLEARTLPAIAGFGVMILTTSGITLITPFPGANSSGAGNLGSSGPSSGSASSVSGVTMPTSLYITGNNGISSLKPGNITGVPSLAGGVAGAAGVGGVSFQIGSGADTGGGTPTAVSRSVVADPTGAATYQQILGPSATSGDADLPAGQTYHDTAPVPPPMPSAMLSPTGSSSSSSAAIGGGMNSGGNTGPNPQMGAPSLGRFGTVGRGMMMGPLPGSLAPAIPIPGNN